MAIETKPTLADLQQAVEMATHAVAEAKAEAQRARTAEIAALNRLRDTQTRFDKAVDEFRKSAAYRDTNWLDK